MKLGPTPWTLGLAIVLMGGAAAAQNATDAERLFDEGIAAMEAGRFAQGCPALELSHKLDPKAGVLVALADCHARWGKTATAVTGFRSYLAIVDRMPRRERARHDARAAMAREAIARLEGQVPELTLVMPDAAPEGATVVVDATPVSPAAFDVPIPMDPGEHVITTSFPGGASHEVKVTLKEGQKQQVLLEFVAETPKPAPRKKKPRTIAPREPTGPKPAYIWGAGAIGAAGLVAGTATGLVVFARKSTIEDNCDGHLCNAEGAEAARSAKRFATVSNVCYGIGVAGTAAAVVLYVMRDGSGQERAGGPTFAPSVDVADNRVVLGASAAW